MAILGATYNPNLGTNDYNYAYQVWKNVNFENNSIKITQEELDAFNECWEKEFKSWETKFHEEDSVEYDLDETEDFDISTFEDELRNNNRNTKGITATTATTTSMNIVSIVGSAVSTANAVNLGAKAVELGAKAVQMAELASAPGLTLINGSAVSMETAQSLGAASQAAQTASQTAGAIGKALCFVGCSLTLATGVLYQATKPNKEAHQALMELQTLMLAGNADIQVQQLLMEQTQEQISNTAVTTEAEFIEAESKQETEKSALGQMQEKLAIKTELLLMATIIQESIRTRLESGEQLSDSDKAQFKAASASIQSLTGEISSLQSEMAILQGNIVIEQEAFEETKAEASDEMSSLQGTYGDRVARFKELQQITDLAGSFDEITQKLCTSQIAMQALNVATGTISMLQAMKYGFFGLPFAAMAISGVGMSVAGIAEQTSFKKDIEKEINLRTQVQENLTTSFNFFVNAVNQYAADSGLVNGLNFKPVEVSQIPLEGSETKIDNTLPVMSTTPTEFPENEVESNLFIATPSGEDSENAEQQKKNPFAV